MQQSYPGVMPMHHNGQHGKLSLKVQYLYNLVVTNSYLIGLKSCSTGGKSYLILYT